MVSFHWSIDDNPYLDKLYVENLKKEYIGLWHRRFIKGEWCVAEGAVYDFFDVEKHCYSGSPPYQADYYNVGVDYGTTNPTVFGLFGNNPMGKPKIWMEREHTHDPRKHGIRKKTDEEHSANFIKFVSPYWRKIRNVYIDPSAESFKVQLRKDIVKAGIGITLTDAENEVTDGIRTVARMLNMGEFMVSKKFCPTFISEAYSYSWDPKKQAIGLDEPLKQNDHSMDQTRYVIFSKFGLSDYDLSKFTQAA